MILSSARVVGTQQQKGEGGHVVALLLERSTADDAVPASE